MAYFPDVQPGDTFQPSALLSNNVRRMVNRFNGYRAGRYAARDHGSVRVSVVNRSGSRLSANTAVSPLESANPCGGAIPVSSYDADAADGQWYFLIESAEESGFATAVAFGTFECAITFTDGKASGGGDASKSDVLNAKYMSPSTESGVAWTFSQTKTSGAARVLGATEETDTDTVRLLCFLGYAEDGGSTDAAGPFDVMLETVVQVADEVEGTTETLVSATIYDSSWTDYEKRPAGTIGLTTSTLSLEYRPKVMHPVEPPSDPYDESGSEEWTGSEEESGSSESASRIDVAGKSLYLVFGIELGASFEWEIVARVEAVESEDKLSCYGMKHHFRWVRLATVSKEGALTYRRTPADVSDALDLYTGEFMLWQDGSGRKMLLNGNDPDSEHCGSICLDGSPLYSFPAELNLIADEGEDKDEAGAVRILLRYAPDEDEEEEDGGSETEGGGSEEEENGTLSDDGLFYMEVATDDERIEELEENDEIALKYEIGWFQWPQSNEDGDRALVVQSYEDGNIDISLARWW